jgi:hypothetical protein
MMNEMPNTAPKRPGSARFGRRVQVTDDGQGNREERTGADALDASEEDEHGHVLRQTRQGGADQEDDDPEHHHRLATVEIGQLAVERHGDRRGQQVDRDDPRVVLVAAEVGDDRGRAVPDGLVSAPRKSARRRAGSRAWLEAQASAGSSASDGVRARLQPGTIP